MIRLEDLKTWLLAQGYSGDVSFGTQPEDPTANTTLRETGGLGFTLEREFDRPTFQALTRGANGRAARDLADEFDRLIVYASVPFNLNGVRVIDTGRVGGGPGYLGTDDRRRTEYSANYFFEIEGR
jgi:hypothetical protein